VSGDGVAAALLDIAEHPLEALIGKRLDPPAVVADDVMVVLDLVAHRLEPREAVAEIDPLDEPLLRQHVQHAVDARQADPFASCHQLAMDLLRADATVLRVEEVDHPRACQPTSISRIPKLC